MRGSFDRDDFNLHLYHPSDNKEGELDQLKRGVTLLANENRRPKAARTLSVRVADDLGRDRARVVDSESDVIIELSREGVATIPRSGKGEFVYGRGKVYVYDSVALLKTD